MVPSGRRSRGWHGRAQGGPAARERGSGRFRRAISLAASRRGAARRTAGGARRCRRCLRRTTASAAAHSPGEVAATARLRGAGLCARGRDGGRVPGHVDHHGHAYGVRANPRGEKSSIRTQKWSHGGTSAVRAPFAGMKRTPRAPTRAHLPLLPSGPGGVRRDDAARGVCTQPSPGPRRARNPPPPGVTGRRFGQGCAVLYPRSATPVRDRRRWCTRRIRLVAYGARLESVLG